MTIQERLKAMRNSSARVTRNSKTNPELKVIVESLRETSGSKESKPSDKKETSQKPEKRITIITGIDSKNLNSKKGKKDE
jgi:hypothetical protein